MSKLPKSYFQDLPADLMAEIMGEVENSRPEPTLEELDQWLNTTEAWFKNPEFFLGR